MTPTRLYPYNQTVTRQHILTINVKRWLLVTSHTLEGLRLHLSLLGISTNTQSLKGLITFRLYGHSIFRFVLSTGVLLKVCVSGQMQSLTFFGVADLRYESSFVGFLKPRPKLTFGWVQGCHSYLDSATPTGVNISVMVCPTVWTIPFSNI